MIFLKKTIWNAIKISLKHQFFRFQFAAKKCIDVNTISLNDYYFFPNFTSIRSNYFIKHKKSLTPARITVFIVENCIKEN